MSLNFQKVYQWYHAPQEPVGASFLCPTRDIFQAKLDSFYRELLHQGVSENISALVVAIVGEIGNNCFDHNLGQWQDVSGAWFEYEMKDQMLTLIIADRGQGVFSSLKRVLPQLKNDQEAIETAFEKRISGRSPEKRGNGLKFVRAIVNGNKDRFLFCCSGKGHILLGGFSQDLGEKIKTWASWHGKGALIILVWKVKS